MPWATCHTEGCENAEIPINVLILDEEGNPSSGTIVCGPCGATITDVSDTEPAAAQHDS